MKKFISILLCITILGCLSACSLYDDYSNRIDDATKYVNVPVAKENIAKDQVINLDMIETAQVDGTKLSEDVIININEVVGKKAVVNISKGSYFDDQNIN